MLGVGLVGPGAGELIAEGVLAIEMGANATDLKLSIHPHPTLDRDDDGIGRSLLRPGDACVPTEETKRLKVSSEEEAGRSDWRSRLAFPISN